MGIGPGDDDLARLERRPQAVERLGRILREFVEEEDSVVREGGLARLRLQPAAGQGGHGGGVVRTAEGPVAGQGAARDQPRHGPDHGGL